MNQSIKLIFIFIFIIFGCSNKSNNINVVGRWQNVENTTGSYSVFNADSTCSIVLKNKFIDSLDLAKSLGVETFYYSMKQKGDKTILITYFHDENKKNKLFSYEELERENNLLVLTSFKIKNYKVVNHHIDEVCTMKRIDKQGKIKAINKKESRAIVNEPSNYYGLLYIVYNSSEEKEEYDGKNRVYTIPETGVLNTKFEARTLDFALNREIFYRNTKKIPTISRYEYIRLKQNEKTVGYYCMDSVYVFKMGYNQVEGKDRYKQINESFDGNIEQFCIDTLKNIINQSVSTYMDKRLKYLESF